MMGVTSPLLCMAELSVASLVLDLDSHAVIEFISFGNPCNVTTGIGHYEQAGVQAFEFYCLRYCILRGLGITEEHLLQFTFLYPGTRDYYRMFLECPSTHKGFRRSFSRITFAPETLNHFPRRLGRLEPFGMYNQKTWGKRQLLATCSIGEKWMCVYNYLDLFGPFSKPSMRFGMKTFSIF